VLHVSPLGKLLHNSDYIKVLLFKKRKQLGSNFFNILFENSKVRKPVFEKWLGNYIEIHITVMTVECPVMLDASAFQSGM
jgi:hypothetical protein